MVIKHPILVVVDMQEKFCETSHKEKTIKECLALISGAKEEKRMIVILEYGHRDVPSDTLQVIKDAVKDYPKAHRVMKNDDDGSSYMQKYFSRKKIKPKEFVLCGVNKDACVKDTARGLANKGYIVHVVKKACNGTYGGFCWKDSYSHENIVLK